MKITVREINYVLYDLPPEFSTIFSKWVREKKKDLTLSEQLDTEIHIEILDFDHGSAMAMKLSFMSPEEYKQYRKEVKADNE